MARSSIIPVALYDEVAAFDASSEIGVKDDVSAGVGDAAPAPLPLSVDVENWPCAASIACIAAGDSLPELLDFFELGSAESEPDIVNGSEPLPKNPLDCVEDDETCEPIDLTTSHAADAAPKAISMIRTSQCRSMRLLLSSPIVSKRRARQKARQIKPFMRETDIADTAIAAAAAGFAAPRIAVGRCPC